MSWKMVMHSIEQEKREEILEAFDDAELLATANDWFLTARNEQMAPIGSWFIWLLLGGRGAGKNFSGSNWLIDQHINGCAKNSFIVAATAGDLRKFCLEGDSGVLSLAPKDFYPIYKPSKTKLEWPDGSSTLLYSAETPDRLRGANHDKGWCDELASWLPQPDDAWNMLMLTMRLANPQVVVTTTPRPLPLIKELVERNDVVMTHSTTQDNETNLSAIFMKNVVEPLMGTRLGRQEIGGELLFDVEGALWQHSQFDKLREPKWDHSRFSRIVVAVDPAVSNTKRSDSTGIVAAGIDATGRAQVLSDHTMKGSPREWGSKAVSIYEAIDADLIVAEKNNGGDLVAENIRAVNSTVNVKLVSATRGKYVRAEPIATQYERGMVTHCSYANLSALEDELCLIAPGHMKVSPNRADAAIWALHELMIKKTKRAGVIGRRNYQ